jgi:adenylosuccinate lyase
MPSSRAAAPGSKRARRDRHLRDQRRGRHVRQHRPEVEEHVAERLGLAVEPISTQVIPRDRHAMFFATLGVVASSIERLAIEVRHLQRTEVLEAEEYFAPGQKGSSAMPHKRNPVLTENLTGLARVVRSAVKPGDGERRAVARARHLALVGRALHRPDACITLDFALARLTGVIDKLLVYPSGCRPTSTAWAGWSTRSACCWR